MVGKSELTAPQAWAEISGIDFLKHRLVETAAAIGVRTPFNRQARGGALFVGAFCLAAGWTAVVSNCNPHIADTRIGAHPAQRGGGVRPFIQISTTPAAAAGGIGRLSMAFGTGLHGDPPFLFSLLFYSMHGLLQRAKKPRNED
jgi:hypothetical protein